MKVSSAVLLALIAGEGSGQGVTTRILPVGGVADGCDASSDGTFQFAVIDLDGHAQEGTLALKVSSPSFPLFPSPPASRGSSLG